MHVFLSILHILQNLLLSASENAEGSRGVLVLILKSLGMSESFLYTPEFVIITQLMLRDTVRRSKTDLESLLLISCSSSTMLKKSMRLVTI